MQRFHSRRRQGFSLLEVTIVLVVVGTVTAGIWSVVTGARLSNQSAMLNQQVVLTLRNVREYFSTRALPATAADLALYTNTKLRTERVFPEDMCSNACVTSGIVRNVYGGATTFALTDANSDSIPDPNSFTLSLAMVKKYGCEELGMQLSSRYAENGLLSYRIGANTAITAFPISLSLLNTQCDGTTSLGSDLVLTFKLRN